MHLRRLRRLPEREGTIGVCSHSALGVVAPRCWQQWACASWGISLDWLLIGAMVGLMICLVVRRGTYVNLERDEKDPEGRED